jgi:hypothetical protein
MVKGMNDLIEAWERTEMPDDRRRKAIRKGIIESIGMVAFIGAFMVYVLFELYRKGNM